MKQPEGLAEIGKENLVCLLKRSIYGLKQSSCCWNEVVDSYLKGIGFIQIKSDPCINRSTGGETANLGVYVDEHTVIFEDNQSEIA